jgi:hypothetical protein
MLIASTSVLASRHGNRRHKPRQRGPHDRAESANSNKRREKKMAVSGFFAPHVAPCWLSGFLRRGG